MCQSCSGATIVATSSAQFILRAQSVNGGSARSAKNSHAGAWKMKPELSSNCEICGEPFTGLMAIDHETGKYVCHRHTDPEAEPEMPLSLKERLDRKKRAAGSASAAREK